MIARQPEPATVSASDVDRWFTPGRFALLLLGLILITFPGIIFGQETFFYRDFGVFGYPLAHYQRECFWCGELPLWNPLNSCGIPFLAQWNTLTLYPFSLFYLIFPLSWSLGVFNLGHLFLAGVGMYFLARRWTNNRFAAAVAGIIFAFHGLTWHALMWPNDIAGLGWMPWVVLTVERAWREGGRQMVWATLAGGMQMLSGAPEIILLTWSFLGVLCVTQLLQGNLQRKPLFFRFVGVVLLVTGLAAAQLLPFLQLLGHSQRNVSYSDSAAWAMPFSGVANFIAPLFHCFEAGQGVFMQRDQYWIASYYTGVGAVMLMLMTFFRPKKLRIWLLICLTIFSVWMALGRPAHLYTIAHAVMPALGFMRYPIKFVVLAVFIIPILAAYGIKRHTTDAKNPSIRLKLILRIMFVVLLLLTMIAYLGWKYPQNGDDWTATWHNIFVRGVFVVLIAAVLIGIQFATSLKTGKVLRIALLLVLWTDVRTYAPSPNPTVPRSVYAEGLMRAELKLKPQAEPGEPRMLASEAFVQQVHYNSITNAANDYLCRRLALFDDCNLIDDVPKIDGFYSLDLKEITEVVGLVYSADARGLDLRGLKDFLGIAHINPPGANQQNALEWIDRTNNMPLVTAGQQPYFANETNSLRLLLNPDYDMRETVALPAIASWTIQAKRTKAKLSDLQIRSHRLTMQVEADAPAMVVVAQAFYKPWHAYVDGQRVELWLANHAFQALEVPAGKHQIKIVYEDRVFQIGLMISFGSLIILGIIWGKSRRA